MNPNNNSNLTTQIITFEKNGNSAEIIPNKINFFPIFNKVRDRKVHIISICGPMRNGRTFLLNFILRFLKAFQIGEDDILGWTEPDNPLEGFQWASGYERITSGIWITTEPIILFNSEGEEIAVFLMDTEGLLDDQNTSSSIETQFILDLCFQLSATVIFNVTGNLTEQQLTTLGNNLQISGNKADKSLTALVRDWANNCEFQCGAIGGQHYKDKLLSQISSAGSFGKSKEALLGLKKFDCFLLPNPGSRILESNYNGNLAGIAPKFLSQLEEFLLSLIDLNALSVNPFPFTGKECIAIIERFVRKYTLTSGGVQPFPATVSQREPQPVFFHTPILRNINPEEAFKELCSKIIDEYKSSITIAISETKHGFMTPSLLEEHHQKYFVLAVEQLTNTNIQISFQRAVKSKKQLELDLDKNFQEIFEINNEKYTNHLKNCDGTLNDCIYLYKARTEALLNKKDMTQNLAQAENKLQVTEIIQKFQILLGSLAEDKELLKEYSSKLKSEATAIFNTEMQAFLTKVRKSLSKDFQNCEETAQAEYNLVINRLTQQDLNNWSQDDLKAFHMQAVNETLEKVSIPENNYNHGNSFEDQLRDTLNENLGLMLDKKNDLASAKEKFVIPAYDNFCSKITSLITNSKSKSVQEFEEDLKKLQSEVCDELKFKAQRTEEQIIVNALLEELKTLMENDTQNYTSEFINKKKIADEQMLKLSQNILQEYRTKMENELQNDKNGKLSLADLNLIHEKIKRKIITDLETKFRNDELNFDLNYEFRIQILEGFYGIFYELQMEQNEIQRAADGKIAEELIQIYAQIYKEKIKNTQWKDLNELESFQGDIMTGEDQLILEFITNCPKQEKEFLDKYLEKLQSEFSNIFSKETPKIQPKFDQLNIKAAQEEALSKIKCEQEEIMMKTKVLESTQFYENEMKKHFRNKSFLRPAEFRQYHESLVDRILKRFGQNLSDYQKVDLRESLTPLYEKYNEINTINTPGNDVAIGIDLGTTYSCVGIYHQGEVKIIPNEFGTKTVPSFVAYTRNGEKIGHTAKDQAHETPMETIFDAKRLIGRTMDDEEVKNDIKYWPFKVVARKGTNNPVIMVNGVPRLPEFISARILKHIKDMVERYLQGKKITKAVITVPAYFNDGQRQATIHAGEIAGLKVLRIINEPTAAAMAYYLHQASTNTLGKEINVLVYDLGGGTFDVSVLAMGNGPIKVLSTKGNTHLGGEDFDGKLVEFCVEQFKKENKIDLSVGNGKTEDEKALKGARQLRRLRAECEKRKKDLSSAENSTIILDAIVNGIDLNIPITRQQFEDMNKTSFEESIQIVKEALADANLKPNEIDEIVLVGGSSKIPKIQKMLKEFFGGKELNSQLDPDEAVARGAAILAAKLNGEQEQKLKKMSLEDVAPLSIGVEVIDGTNSVIIPRNARIPCSFTKVYQTAEDNQTELTISIYQGEKPKAKDNTLLGEFELSDIPSKKKGVEKINVTMKIDEQGILNVIAECKSNGDKNEIIIREDKGRLSKEDIQKYCNELG